MIERLAVIGVGLIGGSLARALRAADAVGEVIGCGRSIENLKLALELGVIDDYVFEPGDAVADADMVFIAVPLGAIAGVFAKIKGRLPARAVVTDGGSVKGSVVSDARRVFGGNVPSWLVPGHPIAGTERSGVGSSFPDLYQSRRVILTPVPETDPGAVARVRAMWEQVGSEVTEMSVEHHDEVLAATSHLPHMLAFGLVDALARMRSNDEIFRYAAGGFRDFTRIASSSPEMWRDICIANADALSSMLSRFGDELNELSNTIRSTDADALLSIFERARAARERYVDGLEPSTTGGD
ncbi:prephenate dehydrogenase [Halochromatium roseum]|uniref:prephenate dehydrogenase n=1 Tax=Halochromatium roseum TaxID=391920 RepID=UPI001912D081|nr:prephenate dehydrogenase/arogenate dehydrogenase family protein [Halochromatium roseum]MBK5937801.1 prephenate dehydrogenase [Halochromatium roseum]